MSGPWSLLWMTMASTTSGQAMATIQQEASPSVPVDQTLLLAVSINGYPTDKVGVFVLRDDVLRARRAEWIALGIAPPASAGSSPDDMLGLVDLPEIGWILDAPGQSLAVTAPIARLVPTVLKAAVIATDDVLQSGTGFSLNYDIDATAAGTLRQASGLFEARVFSPWGVVSTGVLAGIVRGRGVDRQTSAIRLDSSFSYADRAALRRYRIGDFITGSLSWTRPIRMGGAQVTADFSTRPDLITFPLPSLRGSAAVPSTIDVLENGRQLFTRDVSAGPFEVPQLPVITGAGTLSLTVRDALGRQVTVDQPFYASATLLSPGLQTFSLQVGAVRKNWGVESNAYAGIAASATWRRGMTPAATIEASAEATRGVAMGGAGLIVDIGEVAILNAGAAASAGHAGTGFQVTAGLHRVGRTFSLAASATLASPRFRDIAAVYGEPVPRLQINASTGVTLGRFGSLGIVFVAVNRDPYSGPVHPCSGFDTAFACSPYGVPAQRTRVLSASYTLQLGRVALYATGYGDMRDRHARGGIIGVTIPLGGRASASVSAGGGGGDRFAQLDVSQSPSVIGDWGYRAFASAGSAPHQFGQVQYKAPWALLSAGIDRVAGETSMRGDVRGSLSIVAGGVFAANAIDDSFAVVDTAGLPNIRVLHENRDVGRTNARGQLLVPDLRAFDLNHIGIEATDLPPDVAIETTNRTVRPQDRSGVLVTFAARASHGALLVLVDEAGLPIPLGSTATLRRTGAVGPVGYDGASYVMGLDQHNALDVVRPDGSSCTLAFDYAARRGDVPTIGPLICKDPAQ